MVSIRIKKNNGLSSRRLMLYGASTLFDLSASTLRKPIRLQGIESDLKALKGDARTIGLDFRTVLSRTRTKLEQLQNA
jgi:hypothetical protein